MRNQNSLKNKKTLLSLKQDLVFQKMVEHLKTSFHCHTIILYGSRARNINVTHSSDYDILAIRKKGEEIREACEFEGYFVDAWIYPEKIIKDVDLSFLKIKDGLIIEQKNHFATRLLKKVYKILELGPSPLPEWEYTLIISWLKKMFQRSCIGDVEGNYRRYWLLFESIEIYFKLRNLWYFGPKESLHWLKIHDKKAFAVFEKALAINAKDSDIQNLISHITDHF